jgi:outer membrane lipoprotein SlyB
VPAGTVLNVRLETTVASNVNREGDPVEALLMEPVVIDDREVLPVGALVKGVVSDVAASGKVKGRAHLGVSFTGLVAHARGNEYEYTIAAHFARTAPSSKGEDAKKVGVGAAGGAIIGGLIGGGKGAAAGAAVGAGGGTAVVLATAGTEVRLDHGTLLALTLERPVIVRVPITR